MVKYLDKLTYLFDKAGDKILTPRPVSLVLVGGFSAPEGSLKPKPLIFPGLRHMFICQHALPRKGYSNQGNKTAVLKSKIIMQRNLYNGNNKQQNILLIKKVTLFNAR